MNAASKYSEIGIPPVADGDDRGHGLIYHRPGPCIPLGLIIDGQVLVYVDVLQDIARWEPV